MPDANPSDVWRPLPSTKRNSTSPSGRHALGASPFPKRHFTNTRFRRGSTTRTTKKVAGLSELSGTDRDVEIEVAIVSHNIRDQMIRGEEKQIAFGMLEDNPWEENGQRTRWDYKDWGPHANLAAGSIVRIEGASVNEYNGKMSLNINQSTRIVVLKEGVATPVSSNDPIDINDIPKEGYICVVGRDWPADRTKSIERWLRFHRCGEGSPGRRHRHHRFPFLGAVEHDVGTLVEN